jgi:putative transposase
VLKAYKYRLYPSRPQQRRLDGTLETARRWYNDCLAQRRAAYELVGWSINHTYQLSLVKTLKASNPLAARVHSHILQLVCTDLDRAFQAFFRRLKAGEMPGYPRFRGRGRFASFGFKEYANGFKLDGRRLKVHGVGRVAVRWHRPLPSQPKTLRLVRQAGDWYAVFVCEETQSESLPNTESEIGIDVGIISLIATSDGEHVQHPGWYRALERRMRVAQRRVARRKKGGANRRKAVTMLQRVHRDVANQRQDFLDKLALKLVREHDVLVLEDLRVRNMVRNHYLGKSILDRGWTYLLTRLSRKAEEAARQVILVDPRNTSQRCSGCGVLHTLSLKDRWLTCACGVSLNRDENAARNILAASRTGQVRWTSSSPLGGLVQEAAGL